MHRTEHNANINTKNIPLFREGSFVSCADRPTLCGNSEGKEERRLQQFTKRNFVGHKLNAPGLYGTEERN